MRMSILECIDYIECMNYVECTDYVECMDYIVYRLYKLLSMKNENA